VTLAVAGFLQALNLPLREQPLVPAMGVLGAGRIGARRFQGAAALGAEDGPRPSILQLITERLTASKISVIEQLAYKNKAFIIVLQETHWTTAYKLVIPNPWLSSSILSRNHSLATFVHGRLEWSLFDQSPEKLETEWLCVDVAGYKIINVYKPPRSWYHTDGHPNVPTPQSVCW